MRFPDKLAICNTACRLELLLIGLTFCVRFGKAAFAPLTCATLGHGLYCVTGRGSWESPSISATSFYHHADAHRLMSGQVLEQ
eukprot:CAMPEP_0184500598 /NCGR_PEP_ID=MMETSP0113_2-20130426/45286_1 /TAXON_ID=91329 /ORGANISM="Norrisiella sphaerica, Strain BC52" /LENGTH=82 /DNA_ID=CAMNT_0026889029 /DNA_START=292 /DNA_END=540 /DNA_ORIENTATION=+